nr:DUF2231 domain-containing protein [uncultured Actinoplanes sp.]
MESRLKIAGQAVQPILVMFPLGLFAMAVIFDAANLLGGPSILGTLAFWNVVAGLVAGILATLAGAIDLAFVKRAETKRVGVLRVLFNMGSLILFAVILMVRVGSADRAAGGGLFLIELIALGVTAFGAWFAGRLANGRTPAFARAAVGQRGY